MIRQPLPPGLRQGRVREEVRHVGRESSRGRPQDPRQAHQGGLHVVLGQRLAADDQAIDARGERDKSGAEPGWHCRITLPQRCFTSGA